MIYDEIDAYFTKNFDDLTTTAMTIFRTCHGAGHVDDLFQEAYMHMRERSDKITVKNIEAFFVQFCRTQLTWSNSKHNISVRKTVPQIRYESEYKYSSETDAINDTQEKILLEKWYTARKSAIAIYKMQKKHNKFLLELYMVTNGSNQVMSERLMVSRSSVSRLIQKMKQDIQEILRNL